MYEVSEAFHRQYADMYDKFVRIYFKDGSVRAGLFNDEFYDDSSILVSCEVIKITDIYLMVGNYEKKENQVYMFFTCFNMFLYSVNSEFYGEKHYHSNTIFIIRHFIFAFIYYEFEKK